jgi:hypothetical protein
MIQEVHRKMGRVTEMEKKHHPVKEMTKELDRKHLEE